jgi:hypothetical protein
MILRGADHLRSAAGLRHSPPFSDRLSRNDAEESHAKVAKAAKEKAAQHLSAENLQSPSGALHLAAHSLAFFAFFAPFA